MDINFREVKLTKFTAAENRLNDLDIDVHVLGYDEKA